MKRLCLNVGCGKDYRESNEHDEWLNIDINQNVKADLHIDLFHLETKYNAQFDYILAQDVIEHTPTPGIAIENLYRLLKTGGKIQIQVPDPYLIFEQLKNGSIDETEFNRLVFSHESNNPYERHFHLISLGRLQASMEQVGLKTLEKKRLNICAIIIGEKV